ncbi:hypothetical protein BX666DRAFT_1971270 [Dichotomocladium elegans]|nr:hypothetical protein BX666DRAFT_1971270 [Dichotomocladium elegans]
MTDKFCFALLRTTALQIIQSAGFDSAHIDPTNILTDIMGQYLQLLASTTSAYAKLAGRATGNAWDVMDGLEEIGVSVDALREWLEEEGKALTPSWSEQSDPGRTIDGVVRNGRNRHEDVLVYEYTDIPENVLEYNYSDDEEEEEKAKQQPSEYEEPAESPVIPREEQNSNLPENIPSYFPPFPSSIKKDATPPPQFGRPLHLAAIATTPTAPVASIAVPPATRPSSPASGAPAPIIVRSRKKPIDNPFTHVVPFEESALAMDKNSSLSLTLHQENGDGDSRLPEAPYKRRRVALSNAQMKRAIISLTSENNPQTKLKQRDELAGNHAMFRKLTQNDAAPGNTMFSSSKGVLSELLHRVAPPAMVSKLSAPNLLVDVVSPSQPATPAAAVNGPNPSSAATAPTAREHPVPIRSSSSSMLASLAGGQYNRKQPPNVEEITASPNTSLTSASSPRPSTTVSALSNTLSASMNSTATGTTPVGSGLSQNTSNNNTFKPTLTPISLASLSAGQEPQKKKTTKLTLNLSNGESLARTPTTAPSTAENTPTSLNTPKIRFKIKPPEEKPEVSVTPPPPPPEDSEENVDIVRCICDNPTVDYGTFMIACDECGIWYHGNCVGVDLSDNVEEWYCRNCKKL